MNISLDIDGVLRDQVRTFTERYLKAYPEHRDLIKPVTAWDMHLFYPLGKEIYKKWFGEWVKDCMEDGYIYDGARDFVCSLREDGHRVFMLTSQPIRTERYTIAWIDKHDIPHDGILFLSQKGLAHFDVLLDDGEHNLEAVKGNGCTPVCFDQPWNQNWKGERVHSYGAFLQMIVTLNGRNG